MPHKEVEGSWPQFVGKEQQSVVLANKSPVPESNNLFEGPWIKNLAENQRAVIPEKDRVILLSKALSSGDVVDIGQSKRVQTKTMPAMDLNTIAADLGLSPELAKGALEEAAIRAARESTKRANGMTRPLPAQVAVMDKTLGRLRRRYEERLRSINLALNEFTSIEQAREAGRLSATYRNLRKRQLELGLKSEPKHSRVVEAERLAEAFYRHFPRKARGNAASPRRGSLPRRRRTPNIGLSPGL